MKIEYISTEDTYDYSQSYEIVVDDKSMLRVADGEPEDNSLARNFNDVFSIPKIIRAAYEAGKRGEPLDEVEIEE